MPEKAAERQKAERRAKAFCHRAAVNGVEGGVPEEGDRVAFEWKFDEGELFHECLARARREGHLISSPDARSGTKRPRHEGDHDLADPAICDGGARERLPRIRSEACHGRAHGQPGRLLPLRRGAAGPHLELI